MTNVNYLSTFDDGKCAKHKCNLIKTDYPEGDCVMLNDMGKEVNRIPSGRFWKVCPECIRNTANAWMLTNEQWEIYNESIGGM